jgi:DNA-binding Lrp family transcriptional regulator
LDERDITLVQLLLMNSRLPYHELASKLGISVNAVQKRINAMVEAGIIRAFRARPSLIASIAMTVLVYGKSSAPSTNGLQEKLSQGSDCIYWVAFAGGNLIYVGGYVREIAQLEQYVAFVKKTAQINDPVVGILPSWPLSSTRPKILRPLDFQIINALHKNSRRPFSDVAEELHASARTVRRRLTEMIEEGLVELSLEWYPDASNDIITVFQISLDPSADRGIAIGLLTQMLGPKVLFSVTFSNLPNTMLCFVWTTSMKDLKDVREKLELEKTFESVIPNVLYTGYMFDTWRDKLPIEGVEKQSRSARTTPEVHR